MSDNGYSINDGDDDGDGNEDFKNLRAKAKKYDAVESENQQLKRELAFTKAGIPMNDPKMTYFVKGYDGDLDPSLIKSAAIEAGFLAPDPQDQQAELERQQAQQGQRAVMQASAGAIVEDSTFEASIGKMNAALNEGGLEALSAYTQQYGVTFNPEPVS